MGLNETPSANRIHIGFFGCRNAGKSSVVNKLTNQLTAVVSEVKGTTTDPVAKAMELLPLGPVVITDTPGYDDEGDLGELRINRTKQIINKTDIAVLVIDASVGINKFDNELVGIFKKKNIPYVVAYNKTDISQSQISLKENEVCISAITGNGIDKLKEKIIDKANIKLDKHIVGDLISPNDIVVLVVPIDESAPKGRLILPQQQVIRDILDCNGIAVVTKETELQQTLNSLGDSVKMVITDSQAFSVVSKIVPTQIPLTSFSILMARYKGFLQYAEKGVKAIESLCDGDIVLIAEGCTHHKQCNDIGSVKIPKLLKKHTNKALSIENVSGSDFPEDLSKYALIIHCGGCMLNEREVLYRMKCADEAGIPVTNYGTALAYMNGILDRSLEIIHKNQ